MLKQIMQFRIEISGVEFSFNFDSGCPTTIAKEALLECLKWIGSIEDQAKAAQEVPSPEEIITENPEG